MQHLELSVRSTTAIDAEPWPIQICPLGNFRLLQAGQPLALRSGGKTEALLCQLGLQARRRVARPALLHLLWPESDDGQASQSLNSLVYSVHKQIGQAIGGAAPVLEMDDAVIAYVAAQQGITYAFVRNISDPLVPSSTSSGGAIPDAARDRWSGLIYEGFGFYTSFSGRWPGIRAARSGWRWRSTPGGRQP